MKKIMLLSLSVLTLLIMVGCNSDDYEKLEVVVPNGAPSIAQIHTQYEASKNDDFLLDVDLVFGADPLRSAFVNASYDVIIAPINLGSVLYQNADAPYQLALPITFGNLHIVSQQSIDSLEDLDGETIIVFGENTVPAITLDILLSLTDFNEAPSITYVDSVDVASAKIQADEDAIALMAEPAKSALNMQLDSLYSIDIQSIWQTHFEQDGYPQAGVFVHTDADSDSIDHYLESLKESIDLVNNDIPKTLERAEALDFPFPNPVIENAIPNSHIRYTSINETKEAVELYFTEILSINPALIGGALPDDAFYYNLE